jgi:hypothetical protein
MGFVDRFKQVVADVSGTNRLRIVEPNAGPDLDGEWLRGRFSTMVVGGSNYVEGFVKAYSPVVWPEGAKRIQREVRDMITLELRRDPGNTYDPNAIAVWSLGSPRAPYSWLAGYLKREVAAKVAPVVDEVGLRSWRHPAELRGTVSLQGSTFGVTVLPGRLLTRGPDMSSLLSELKVGYRPATEKQIAFVHSLLGGARDMGGGISMSTELSKKELAVMLSRVGNPPDWKDAKSWARLDSHQISVAIDVLQGSVLWVVN